MLLTQIFNYYLDALKSLKQNLLDYDVPVIFSLQDQKEAIRRTESAIDKVHTRGANIYLTTDIGGYKNAKEIIHLPRNDTFSAILNIILYYTISYYLSIVRGLDKVVTTD